MKNKHQVPKRTKFLEEHEEFYWNVTGNDWLVPIDYASATIFFPEEASGKLKAQAFSGVYGSAEKAKASVEGAVVTTETLNPLEIRGGLTVDVYVPQGILHKPGLLTQIAWFFSGNPVVTLPLWALTVMFLLWWFKGRDPDPGISVAPMYAPPENLGPAEAGPLVDEGVPPRDITAVLGVTALGGEIKLCEVSHPGCFHKC